MTAGQSTALTVIRKLDPVYVDVTQSASELLQWRRSGQELAEEAGTVVTLRLADGETYEHEGILAAAEPHVNEQTGWLSYASSSPTPTGFSCPGCMCRWPCRRASSKTQSSRRRKA